MPTLPIILSQLAERLLANGAQFSPRAMEIISAAMSFLEAIGNPLDDEVSTAAYVTSLLKSDNAKQAATALGASQDLVPILTPNVVGVVHQLVQVLAGGSRPQAVVAATVFFSWHAMAVKADDEKWLAALRTIADNATLQGSQNPELARTLTVEMNKVRAKPRPASAPREFVFSISIDLVGSTDAKTRVMSLAKGEVAKVHKYNEQIYREFCRIETSFYEDAVSHYGASAAIDPSKFFTVNGIGDEVWILCTVAEQDISSVGHRLIDAGIKVAAKSVSFLATENEPGPVFDREFDYGEIQPIVSPIKIFIDLVGQASNLGRIRDEELVKAIPNLLKSFHGREPVPLEIASVVRRLCVSRYEPIGWWEFHEFRTDYIGHEIDRFFRTTKAAVPGTVTIGASYAREMGLMFKPVKHGIHGAFTSSKMPLIGGFRLTQCIPAYKPSSPIN